MKKTKLSLYYVASYLTVSGLALTLTPTFALKLFFSNGDYGEVMPRMAGLLILALAVIVVQVIRHQVEVLYPTTLVARALLVTGWVGLYVYAHDPFFLVVAGIVGFGMVLTGVSWLRERSAKEARP